MKKPYAIIIMDGYGLNPKHEGNAVYADGSKNVTELEKEYPSSTLGASGMSVAESCIRILPKSRKKSATANLLKTPNCCA